jgi:HK97 family phage major capsid protein
MTILVENIQRLLDERANAWRTAGQPLADIAAERAFTAEEQERFDRASADFTSMTHRINALTQQREQERAADQYADALGGAGDQRHSVEAELRAVLVERTQESMEYRFTDADFQRVLASGTPSAGGNVIPTTFLDRFIEPLRDLSSVLSAGATIWTTESGEDMPFPTLTDPGAAQANVAESATRGGTDPAFGKLTLKAYEHSQLIVAPRRLVQDSAIDLEGLIARLLAENIGQSLASKLAIGSGTNETAGIATASTVGKTGGTGLGGGATFDDVIDLVGSVKAPYRIARTTGFLMADQQLTRLRKEKANGTGEYLWTPSVQVGMPDLILGKPVFADANLEYGLGKKSIIFGDISRYWVRLVGSIEVARSEHANFATNGTAFRGILRADGLLTDAGSVKAFSGGAS